MRSFSAQAESRPARVLGGIFVARWSTASASRSAICSETRSKRSASTGSAPSRRSSVAFSGERLRPRTVWPAPTRRRTTGRPRTPVAPVTKTFMYSFLSFLLRVASRPIQWLTTKAFLEPRERFVDGALIHALAEARHEVRNGLPPERPAPCHLGAQHGSIDGAGQTIHRWL